VVSKEFKSISTL